MAELKAVELQDLSNGHTRRNRKIMLAIGGVALVGAAGVVAGLHHAQTSNNKSMDVLRSLSQAHALKINVEAYGNLVEYGDDQNYTIYAVPYESTYNLWMTSLAPDGQEFNLTVKNNRGYYSFQNKINASSDPLIECLQPTQMMPLAEIARSILETTVVHDMDQETKQSIDCEEGTVVTGSWASRDFVYCVDSSDMVTALYSENLVVHIEYLLPREAREIENKLKPKSTTHCPVLEVGEAFESRKLNAQRSLKLFRKIKKKVVSKVKTTAKKVKRALNKVKKIIKKEVPNYDAFAAYYSAMGFPEIITNDRVSLPSRICVYDGSNPKAMVLKAKFSRDRKSVALSHYTQPKKWIFNGLKPIRVSYGVPTTNFDIEDVVKIKIPQNCVWIHGDGYSKHSPFLAESYYEAFGSQGLDPPCHCKKTYFIQANTAKYRWHSKTLQKHLCSMLKKADEASPLDGEINNVIINAHYSGALAFGAALANGYCSLGPNSQLNTIHAPLNGLALPKKDSSAIDTLCDGIAPIQKDIERSRRRFLQFFRAAFRFFVQAIINVVLNIVDDLFADWTNLFPTVSECRSPSWTSHREEIWEALRPPSEMKDPKMVEQFEAAANALGKNVDAAICGTSEEGSVKEGFSKIDTSTLFQHTGKSDKVVPLESCLKLQSYIAANLPARQAGNRRLYGDYQYTFDSTLDGNSAFLMLDVSFTDVKTNTDSYACGQFSTGLLSIAGAYADSDVSGFSG